MLQFWMSQLETFRRKVDLWKLPRVIYWGSEIVKRGLEIWVTVSLQLPLRLCGYSSEKQTKTALNITF